jgi:hypothetical protein
MRDGTTLGKRPRRAIAINAGNMSRWRACWLGATSGGRSISAAGSASWHSFSPRKWTSCLGSTSPRERSSGRGSGRRRFEQADILDLPASLDRGFDLVVLADTLYYLSPLDDAIPEGMAARVADLLVPGGLCVLVNHYFFAVDSDSRLSRRIHGAFARSPRLRLESEQRRPFFLVSQLTEQPAQAGPARAAR